MGEFVAVGKVSEVPEGEMAAFDADGHKVAVANVDGTYYGFDDTCTHMQCSLSEGDLDGTTLTCYCHGSQFEITTGAVVGPPATEPLETFPVRGEGEVLQVEV